MAVVLPPADPPPRQSLEVHAATEQLLEQAVAEGDRRGTAPGARGERQRPGLERGADRVGIGTACPVGEAGADHRTDQETAAARQRRGHLGSRHCPRECRRFPRRKGFRLVYLEGRP